MRKKIRIEDGDINDIIEVKFNSDIEAQEFCQKKSINGVRYSLLTEKELRQNKGG